ncbi:MAG: radical SAM protein, partial [Treponema sp.]|nr:radical SAM protein [Treponema sp.]
MTGTSATPILLVTINAKWIHPSLALRLLKANLGELTGSCTILEFALRQPLSEKIDPILAARPRILGFSVSIWNHRATLELLEALEKQQWSGTANTEINPPPVFRPFIVLGGPEASFLPEDAPIFRYADFVIRGEGETAFQELCESLYAGEKPGKFIQTPPLDPARIRSGYDLYTAEDLHRKLIYVESSRGCPFGCEFCLSAVKPEREPGPAEGGPTDPTDKSPANSYGEVRYFPLEPFLNEMETLIQKGVRTFKFLDRTFNLDIDRARRIMEFFLERISPSQNVHFEMVPSRFPPELVETLSRFPPGTLRLEIGIQTLNPQTARLIRRPGDPAAEMKALELIRRETAAIIHADLIAGLPGEDLASFGAGFDRLWQALSVPSRSGVEIQVGILKRLPGAPITRHDKPCGMVYAPGPPYEVQATAVLPAAGLDRIKNFARFWE